MLNKDQSIITQVAAKIAADLVIKQDSIDFTLSDWAKAFEFVQTELFNAHNMSATAPTAEAVIAETFGNIEPVATATSFTGNTSGGVRVKGKQHGPLPEWLIAEASKAGVSEVWDNRDKLAENPKRPWFKAVNGDKAFWQPKGR